MPSRNIIRYDLDDAYYHVYARGAGKSIVFHNDADKEYFLYLLSRHLSIDETVGKKGYVYPHYRDKVELLTYCLMGNHYHLLFYQFEKGSMSQLMKSITTAYVAYFNRKNSRSGPLFESRFKASLINNDRYLMHISRYIHLNPRSWKHYPHSSLVKIRKEDEPEWLQTEKILELFDDRQEYLEFVADYEENKQMLDEIKSELANL